MPSHGGQIRAGTVTCHSCVHSVTQSGALKVTVKSEYPVRGLPTGECQSHRALPATWFYVCTKPGLSEDPRAPSSTVQLNSSPVGKETGGDLNVVPGWGAGLQGPQVGP